MADDLHLLSIACGGCAAVWAGHDRAHCARCHTTYDSITLYDAHRTGSRCARPQALGLASTKNGIWRATTSVAGSGAGSVVPRQRRTTAADVDGFSHGAPSTRAAARVEHAAEQVKRPGRPRR